MNNEQSELLMGKMRFAVYLFHCARIDNNNNHKSLAMKCLNEVKSALTRNSPWEYNCGLAGTGAAISYLARNGFIEADEDVMLSTVDRIISQYVFCKHIKMDRDTGLPGTGFYLLQRIRNGYDQSIICLRLAYLLLMIQDIVFARLGMEGYSYPYANGCELSAHELSDCKRFLRQMLKTGLCPELTRKALAIAERSGSAEDNPFARIENLPKDDSQDSLKHCMEQLVRTHENPIVKGLAELQLQDLSLPAWWELF